MEEPPIKSIQMIILETIHLKKTKTSYISTMRQGSVEPRAICLLL